MGMFDKVICEVPLPDGWKPEASDLQTKDFECCLTTIKISSDGKLHRLEWESEPYDLDEPDWLGMTKGLRRINERWAEIWFHGFMNFYGNETDGWHEYSAKFTDGELVSIMVVQTPATGLF
jgi:hypothetical protein